MAEGEGDAASASEEQVGDESLDEGEAPPELLRVENEAFGMQFKAKQKIAEVRKLRQYYRKPDSEAKRRALAERMKVNPCHTCGQFGHWSRECPQRHQQTLGTTKEASTPSSTLGATSSLALSSISENRTNNADEDWHLLVSPFRTGPQVAANRHGGEDCSRYRGGSARVWAVQTVFVGSVGFEVREVLWSLEELAFKIILGIGCMRSVVGVKWANILLSRWQREGRWFMVEPEAVSFKFGDGAVLVSKFRIHFMGSFAGQQVIYGFSVVEGNCPPLFSRSGCSQIGAMIDCDDHSLAVKKLKVRSYGVGRDTGHYTMRVDECEPACGSLPRDFRLPENLDIMPIDPEILWPSAELAPGTPIAPPQAQVQRQPSSMQDLQAVGSQDQGLPSDWGGVRGRSLEPGADGAGLGSRRVAEEDALASKDAAGRGSVFEGPTNY